MQRPRWRSTRFLGLGAGARRGRLLLLRLDSIGRSCGPRLQQPADERGDPGHRDGRRVGRKGRLGAAGHRGPSVARQTARRTASWSSLTMALVEVVTETRHGDTSGIREIHADMARSSSAAARRSVRTPDVDTPERLRVAPRVTRSLVTSRAQRLGDPDLSAVISRCRSGRARLEADDRVRGRPSDPVVLRVSGVLAAHFVAASAVALFIVRRSGSPCPPTCGPRTRAGRGGQRGR
jgi:hypothetical protein